MGKYPVTASINTHLPIFSRSIDKYFSCYFDMVSSYLLVQRRKWLFWCFVGLALQQKNFSWRLVFVKNNFWRCQILDKLDSFAFLDLPRLMLLLCNNLFNALVACRFWKQVVSAITTSFINSKFRLYICPVAEEQKIIWCIRYFPQHRKVFVLK